MTSFYRQKQSDWSWTFEAYFLSLGGKTNFIMNILPTFICILYCMYTYTGHAGLGRYTSANSQLPRFLILSSYLMV